MQTEDGTTTDVAQDLLYLHLHLPGKSTPSIRGLYAWAGQIILKQSLTALDQLKSRVTTEARLAGKLFHCC